MATCVEQISSILLADDLASIPVLASGVPLALTITPTVNQLAQILLPTNQIVSLSVNLVTVGSVNCSLTVFRRVGNSITNIGSAPLGDPFSFTQFDLQAGNYIVCIRSLNAKSYTGSVTGTFVGFPGTAVLDPQMGTGESVRFEFAADRPPRQCNEALKYEIVEGYAPPGISFNSVGRLEGTLPNLDCVLDNSHLSPSQGWYYEANDGTMHPWGRQYRFKVRLSIEDQPDIFTERWFCIKVHNNWSLDRDRLAATVPFTRTERIEVVKRAATLPEVCAACPEPVEEPRRPIPIAAPACEPCEKPETQVEFIKLPKHLGELPVNEIVVWWKQILSQEHDGPTKEFVERLKASPLFQRVLRQAGFYVGEPPDPNVEVAIADLNGFIQLTISNQVDGRNTTDVDARMLKWKDEQNQKLPITIEKAYGTWMEVTLR